MTKIKRMSKAEIEKAREELAKEMQERDIVDENIYTDMYADAERWFGCN